jgi:hypothetical protein
MQIISHANPSNPQTDPHELANELPEDISFASADIIPYVL